MFLLVKVGVYFCSLSVLVNAQITRFTSQLPKDLPTSEKFLEGLFNTTALEVIKIAQHFDLDKIHVDHINILLYDKDGSYQTFDANSSNIPIDKSKPVKVIIHGWKSTAENTWVRDMALSYHNIGIKNVYAIDWSTHSNKSYLHSASSTKKVGEIVGDFILKLMDKQLNLFKKVHIIGHSLGAQVSGFAGKHIQNLTHGINVARITGLDAAAPLFEFPIKLPSFLRLSEQDADYVDSIHTNAGFLGFLAAFGTADFYVEFGGPIQPGCLNAGNIFESFSCSHSRSHDIFTITITSKEYHATSCDNPVLALANLCQNNDKVIMGEHTSTSAKGDYYIQINEKN